MDTFECKITDKNGAKKTIRIPEKRVVTYNAKLAQKQIYEINKQVEKARKLSAVQEHPFNTMFDNSTPKDRIYYKRVISSTVCFVFF